MFAHFDRLTEANQAFHRIVNPNLYSWNAIMLAYVKSGHHQIALKVYQDLQNSCPELDGHIFVSALRTCFSPVNLGQGRQIHMQAIENGFEFDDYVGSTLVEMYAKCSDLESALAVFNRLPRWRAISCSLLIGGFVDAGEEYIALELFRKMVEKDVELDEVSYISILEACSNIAALGHGRQIHALLIELGLEFDVRVGNAIIDVYVNCQRLLEADTLFHRLPVKDIVTWTTLASGYAYNGFNKEAMQIFDDMEHYGVTPNSITLVLILRACSSVSALEQGRRIHARIVECGTELDDFAGSSLIDMYGKCGSPDDAIIMFERLPKTTAIAWSALIAGTADNEEGSKAFLLFEQMQRENVIPDRALFVCILKACSDPTHLDYGRFIHCHVAESGLGTDIFLANALIDMYVKCESLEDACTLSKTLPEQDLVTWSLLIGGHVQQGFALEALQFFDKMCNEGVEPDGTSFVCALKACSSIAALQQGRRIHGQAIEKGYELDPFVSSTLIDMYAKCGSLEDAQRDFERLPKPNIVDWGALMSGYAQIGNYSLVLQYFKAMQSRGIEPDEISFLSLLAACSRAGLLDAGCAHFKEMRDNHGSVPSLKHYNSLVDIFGHTGCLEEVEDLLETIPFGNNLVGWTSLLTSCRRYFDPSTGRRSFDRFIVMDRTNATGYVLMENIYSQMGMWDDANEIEELRKYANGWKKPGKAFIEIGNQVHNFAVGDKSHKESSAIYAKLEGLNLQLQEEGYVPRVDLVMDSTSEDDKVDALCGHCEKLAIAFGLISTVPGTTLRVSKNLRMCADCHNATRLISKLERREIIVVDAYCTHHFGNGICSCTEHL
ncbi:hypothetical protein KP509_32G058000 [Ceratopteris richardii]|nr:hypothetical protein KP509_32G058000 [Ceratopteris richardii]KAH7287480.1 hypothetical protein KP509_32G058000 [Ceratopteris richardii]KAH7287481.1 hypothetical protein KP509_32G058000 [Ceratopteris richardii]KAH7287482.1 hypothetical protein KP509_32G058000 [Ceratopteris richardii]KAH7287483.1 hypothetical protein KP509_32G058000 [Ceratopteris richardii]